MKRKVLALFMAVSVAVSSLPTNALTTYGSETVEGVQLLGEETSEDLQPDQASSGETVSEEESRTQTEAQANSENEAATEAPASSDSEPVTEAPVNSENEAAMEAPANSESEPVTEALAEPESEPVTKAPANSESEPATEAPANPESETATEAPAEPESEAKAEAEAPSNPESETETEAPTERPEGGSITAPEEIFFVSVKPGGSVVLESKAEGEGSLTHQWYGPDGMIVGATESTYTLQCPSSDGYYYCTTSNESELANTRYSVIVDTGLKILWDETTDKTQVVPYGSDCELKIAATVNEGCTLHYIWKENGEEIPEARDQANYMVQDIRTPRYFDCWVNDGYGTTGTHQIGFPMAVVPDTLTVEAVSDMWPQVKMGDAVTFQVEASTLLEGGSFTYQWYKAPLESGEEVLLSEFTGKSCTIDSVMEPANYFCCVSDGCETEDVWFYLRLKSAFEFDLNNMNPYIQVKPEETFTMEVKTIAEKGTVLSYAWEDADGNPIGENSPTLSQQAGFENTQYRCTVTDQNGVSDTTSFNI